MADHLPPWWVWVCIALVPGVLELPAPDFIFPGFGIGALAMALLVAVLPAIGAPALLARSRSCRWWRESCCGWRSAARPAARAS